MRPTGPKNIFFKVGDTILLTGTVGKHDEYKGRKQTELKRCIFKAVVPAIA
jgi:hypothetical protein